MLIAQAAQHPEKIRRGNTNTRAALDGLHEHSTDGMVFEQRLEMLLRVGKCGGSLWKGREMAELAQLFFERVAEMLAVGGDKRAVA